ncbi:Transmembrane ascorbate ferrireductase 1, partial [Cucurbita argyrosperma subsp. argyrosperma]
MNGEQNDTSQSGGERERESGGEKSMGLPVKAFPFTVVSHVLAIVALILVLVWAVHFRGGLAWEAVNKNLIFNIHPVLMLLGLIIIGGEAIISYKSLPLRKEVKKVIHLVLHGVALALGIVGIWAAFKNHNESGIPNLYSLHSWIGIGVIALYGVQCNMRWGTRRGVVRERRFRERGVENTSEAFLVNFTASCTIV